MTASTSHVSKRYPRWKSWSLVALVLVALKTGNNNTVSAWTSTSTKISSRGGQCRPPLRLLIKTQPQLKLQVKRQSGPCGNPKFAMTRLASSNDKDNDNDDDGWGDSSDAAKELEALRSSRSAAKNSKNNNNEPPERDLFIPIFTAVAVVGFGGLYAYETLRLYLNGELYLPGGH